MRARELTLKFAGCGRTEGRVEEAGHQRRRLIHERIVSPGVGAGPGLPEVRPGGGEAHGPARSQRRQRVLRYAWPGNGLESSVRVTSFRIKNFRSIETAEVPLTDLTCLVGANNEGKSNILRAAIVATSQMLGIGNTARPYMARRRYPGDVVDFIPHRDLPRDNPGAKPSVEITLHLTDSECSAFHTELGHKINGELRFKIDLQKPGSSGVTVLKQKSGGALTEKSPEIAEFVGRRLRLEYIPAVRTAEQAVDVVRRLVADQLRVLRRDKEYLKALESVRELEEPLLRSIERDLVVSLGEFLPDLSAIQILRSGTHVAGPLGSSIDVEVDDGVATDLAAKGDGVQSLAAIALARRAAQRIGDDDHHLILAIEEPETHLHPAAIRRLRTVLREISQEQQVILTTHSPLLIDTEKPSANVVVENQTARPARRVSDIRECLGVAVADNLTSARLVVLVEGPGDAAAISALLSSSSERLADVLLSGELMLEPLNGASKLSAHASAMRATACSIFASLDGDEAGIDAVNAAVSSGRIATSDYMLMSRRGMKESEFEDLLKFSAYRHQLEAEFGVRIPAALANGKGPKWSDKLQSALKSKYKLGNKYEIGRAKALVSEVVVAAGRDSLNAAGRTAIDQLATELERRLS